MGRLRQEYPDWPRSRHETVMSTRPRWAVSARTTFGLYDMHGNVWEWCSDDFAYNVPPFNDPAGPPEAQQRMIRGGSWEDEPRRCLSGAFVWVPRNYRRCDAGFRLVLVPPDR